MGSILRVLLGCQVKVLCHQRVCAASTRRGKRGMRRKPPWVLQGLSRTSLTSRVYTSAPIRKLDAIRSTGLSASAAFMLTSQDPEATFVVPTISAMSHIINDSESSIPNVCVTTTFSDLDADVKLDIFDLVCSKSDQGNARLVNRVIARLK